MTLLTQHLDALAATATTVPAGASASHPPFVEATLFYLLAGVTAAAAIGVVASRNVVRTAVSLLFALLGVAGLFLLLDAEFLAAAQVVVYVGGTLILIVFGVMLTSKSPFSRFEPTRQEVFVATAGVAVLLVAVILAMTTASPPPPAFAATRPATGPAPAADGTATLGLALLGDYLLPFELASVILLAVMVGAAYLARSRQMPPAVARTPRK